MHRLALVLLPLLLVSGCTSDSPAPPASSRTASTPTALDTLALTDEPSEASGPDLALAGVVGQRLEDLGALAQVARERTTRSDVRALGVHVQAWTTSARGPGDALAQAYVLDVGGAHSEDAPELESALRADVPRLQRAARPDLDVDVLHRLVVQEALLAGVARADVAGGRHRPAVELAQRLLTEIQADTLTVRELLRS